MSAHRFTQLDVFTATALKGNPLAVVHDAAGLSDAQIGFLWAEGVLAEVILFALGQRVAQHVDLAAGVAVQGHSAQALAQRGLQLRREPVRVFHGVELDHAARVLHGIGMHALHVLADQAGQLGRQGG